MFESDEETLSILSHFVTVKLNVRCHLNGKWLEMWLEMLRHEK